jgi:hypothetical protein
MPSRSQLRPDESVFRLVSRAGLGWACALLVIAVGGGCASPPQPATPYVRQTAVVMVENHTEWPWRIAFVRAESTTASAPPPSYTSASAPEAAPAPPGLPWLTLAPREIRRIDLPGGIYRVHREVLRAKIDPVEPETSAATDAGVSLWFVPGRSYTWPLATLFSTEEVAP